MPGMRPVKSSANNATIAWAQESLEALGFPDARPTRRAAGSQAEVLIFEASGASRGKAAVLKTASDRTSPQALTEEYRALGVLNEALGAVTGVSSPEPLALHPDGSAYLMTHVSGVSVDSVDLTQASREALAEKLLDALGAYYDASGKLYGDLQPQNVLVDGATLSLIDPTLPAQIHRELAATMQHAPASADLADWVSSVVSRAGATFVRAPTGALRRALFTQALILAAPARFGARPEPFLEEIERGARVRLARLAAAKGFKGRLIEALGTALLRRVVGRALSQLRT